MPIQADLLLPVLGMLGITVLVWLRLYLVRIPEMRRRRIDPQSIASSAAKSATLQDTRASDNFSNLFEMPVLFYVGAFAMMLAGQADATAVALAWLFVALRAVHSAIHCTYNRVMHRFIVYALSSLVLIVFLGRLAWALLA